MRFIRVSLQSIDSRLASVENRLTAVEDRLTKVEDRLATVEDRVDRRLQETRPIWERALNEIVETRAEVEKVENRLGRIENEIKDLRRMYRHTYSDVTLVQEDLEERLDKIEAGDRTL
jgi:archaellum component FlaC